MIKHIVLFSFNGDPDSPEIKELHRRFCHLPELIREVISFESGRDISVEGISRGFHMAYVLGFNGTEERDRYLVHPRHRDFSDFAAPLLKDVLVFDYDSDAVLT